MKHIPATARGRIGFMSLLSVSVMSRWSRRNGSTGDGGGGTVTVSGGCVTISGSGSLAASSSAVSGGIFGSGCGSGDGTRK